MLQIIVLGAGAGGGFPQWNCNCANCQRARAGDPLARPATQSSLAVSGDGGASWYLLNASPDLRQQIAQTPQLYPRNGDRDSPISGVILTNADVDHVAGLLIMREAQPFYIYGMPRVLEAVRGNALWREDPEMRDFGSTAEDTIGLELTATPLCLVLAWAVMRERKNCRPNGCQQLMPVGSGTASNKQARNKN